MCRLVSTIDAVDQSDDSLERPPPPPTQPDDAKTGHTLMYRPEGVEEHALMYGPDGG